MLVHRSRIDRLDVPARAIFSSPAVFKRKALNTRKAKTVLKIHKTSIIQRILREPVEYQLQGTWYTCCDHGELASYHFTIWFRYQEYFFHLKFSFGKAQLMFISNCNYLSSVSPERRADA